MKKIIIILSIIVLISLIGFGVFYFFGNGKQKISSFFSENTDFGSFFDTEPQSQNDFIPTNTEVSTDQTTPTNQTYQAPVLRQISFEPVSGYTFYGSISTSTRIILNDKGVEVEEPFISTSTAVRFQERATGHIYDVFESIQAPQKISTVTINKVYSTLFSNNKNQFIYQTLSFDNEQVNTTSALFTISTSSEPILQKTEISSIVNDFIYNKDSNKLIYSVKQNNVSNIYTSSITRTDEKLITTIPFNEFVLESINKNEVLLTTKASRLIPGYSYIINTTTNSFTKILGAIPGLLTKVSPDKKYYVYSQSEQTRPSLRSYNTTTKETNIITIDTLPEKCVFSKENVDEIYCFGAIIYKTGIYPDDWYKGKIFNNDSLYKINLSNNSIFMVYNFQIDDLSFDVINPQLTNKDAFILFQNKYDLTLWSLNLEKLSNELI